jgi:hypothetical protein
MSRKPVLLAMAVVVVAVIAAALWLDPRAPGRERLRIDGAGDEATVVRAEAESESVLPEALAVAQEEAKRLGVKTLIVHRRGHRIFEYHAPGSAGTDLVDGGDLAAAILQLALHQPEDASADAGTTAQLLGERIWMPLRAADAWFSDGGPAGAVRNCCIEARLDDWMRAADLVNGGGTYLGERVISVDAVRALLSGRVLHAQGDEPLLARDGVAFDLDDEVRVWLAPRRGLSMLVRAGKDRARDTLLPNVILRGLNDAAPAIGGGISDLVPGH